MRAVSFFVGPETVGCDDGVIVTEAFGTATFAALLEAAGGVGAFGALGAAGAPGAFGALGGTLAAPGGLGADGTDGAPGGRGGGLLTTPEGMGGLAAAPGPAAGAGLEIITVCCETAAGGFGAEGAAEGTFAADSGAAGGGTKGFAPTFGGFEIVIRVDSFFGWTGVSPVPGLDGRLIRTVSRFKGEFPAADGRGGSVIRTVSFFGSLMFLGVKSKG